MSEKKQKTENQPTVKVKLSTPVTVGGKPYNEGDSVEVSAQSAKWLVAQKCGEIIGPKDNKAATR